MTQPELGKKISELRLAKGLTQGELAEKCNLSLRTIQRIESAEVTPRSYTVKQIFESLDYEIYSSFGKLSYMLDRMAYRFKNRLGQFYKYIIDLFNLRTNTMKKIMILSVPFLTLCLVLTFSFTASAKAQGKKAIREEFERISTQSNFVQWFNSGQFDSITLQYLENAFFMPDQYPTITDRESINAYYKQLYNRGLRFSEVKTISSVIYDSIAVETGTWKATIDSTIIVSGTSLTQWHYVNGEWGIENEMSKTDNITHLE